MLQLKRGEMRQPQPQPSPATASESVIARRRVRGHIPAKSCKGKPLGSTQAGVDLGSIATVKVGPGYRYYYAYIDLEGLEIFTRRDKDLAKAQRFRSALVNFKHNITSQSELESGGVLCEEQLRRAVENLPKLGVSVEEMDLKFKVKVRTLWIRKPLRSRAFAVATELELGLRTWRKLSILRSGGAEIRRGRKHVLKEKSPETLQQEWNDFKEEYTSVLQLGSNYRTADSVSHRMQELEQVRNMHFEKQMERWNLEQMRAEEQKQRHAEQIAAAGAASRTCKHLGEVDNTQSHSEPLGCGLGTAGGVAAEPCTASKNSQPAATMSADAQVEKRILTVLKRWSKLASLSGPAASWASLASAAAHKRPMARLCCGERGVGKQLRRS